MEQVDSPKTNRNGMYEIQDLTINRSTTTMRSTHKSERQVLMQYRKAAYRGPYHEEMYFVM